MPNFLMNKSVSKLFLICFCIILVSCNARNESTPVFVNRTPTIDFTPSVVPSQTTVFTPTISPTKTPEQTATLTPPPTLSLEMRDSELRQVLQNNVDCKLPCFMGITPEQTTLGELNNFFIRYGLHPYDFHGVVFQVIHDINNAIAPDTSFYVPYGVVRSMRVRPIQSNEFEWAIFSPANVLQDYGAPSKVTFGLQVIHEPSPTPRKAWYIMTFYYEDLDFIIQYSDAEIELGKLITVCPNKDYFSQGAFIWLGKNPEHPPLPTQDGPLEDVTSFTPESFGDFLLLGPGACFDLKASAIPIY